MENGEWRDMVRIFFNEEVLMKILYSLLQSGTRSKEKILHSPFSILHSFPHSPLNLVVFSRKEASSLRHEFWTSLGQYMAPILSAEAEKINWINYRTGEKDIRFRMYADNNKAGIAIELTHRDHVIRQIYFEQFLSLRKVFDSILQEDWTWLSETSDEAGRPVSRIFKEMEGISVFKKDDWPELISFFKPRIIALDEFWSQTKYFFEALK